MKCIKIKINIKSMKEATHTKNKSLKQLKFFFFREREFVDPTTKYLQIYRVSIFDVSLDFFISR